MKSLMPNLDGFESDGSWEQNPGYNQIPSDGEEEDSSDSDDTDSDSLKDEEGNEDEHLSMSESDSDEESEAEATLQEIFQVEPNPESQRDIPPVIETDSSISDICFHPKKEIIAASTLDGDVIMYSYEDNKTEELKHFKHHRKACRAVCFNDAGDNYFSIGKDKTIAMVNVETGQATINIKDAHESPIYSFCPIDEYLCATGDDDGTVKIWDYRRKTAVLDFRTGEQTVTSLTTDEAKKTLCSSVNDGSIAGFCIRGKKLILQSELYESEFTSVCLIRGDSKAVVGSGEGVFYIFNWGEFGRHIDRFAGHPDEIYCVASITDKVVVSGSEDGIIRATHFYPHRFMGVIGQHKGGSVDNLSLSYDGKLLASCGMDEAIRFWNIDYLFDLDVDGRKKGNKEKDVVKNLPSSRCRNKAEFFTDFPDTVESDDENGPVNAPCNMED